MPKTLNRGWVHAVWSTKYRKPLIKRYYRGELNSFIKQQGTRWDIQIDTVNCMPDQIHVLMKIPTTINISEFLKLIKGASSKWVNDHYFPSQQFQWQEGYGVFSVSRKDLSRIKNYIYNQEVHHKKKSYKEEIKKLSKADDLIL